MIPGTYVLAVEQIEKKYFIIKQKRDDGEPEMMKAGENGKEK